jgi:hypothetical protein
LGHGSVLSEDEYSEESYLAQVVVREKPLYADYADFPDFAEVPIGFSTMVISV